MPACLFCNTSRESCVNGKIVVVLGGVGKISVDGGFFGVVVIRMRVEEV